MIRQIFLKRHLTDEQGLELQSHFLGDNAYDEVIREDTDGYSMEGELLFRFRKNAIPFEILRAGYEGFKDCIKDNYSRPVASGAVFKRVRKDGTVSNQTIGNTVRDGVVGYLDPGTRAQLSYCRKTSFTRDNYELFKMGVPFVEYVDRLYSELCPTHYKKQKAIATGTNKNFRISDTAFTTVTVNENFRTAVHKDSGDFREGFGNLVVYREGKFDGFYFCLPEFRAAIDMQNTDVLFVDVHRWHGNTPVRDEEPGYKRIAFVMYYREYMIQCKQPSEELERIKKDRGGFYKI